MKFVGERRVEVAAQLQLLELRQLEQSRRQRLAVAHVDLEEAQLGETSQRQRIEDLDRHAQPLEVDHLGEWRIDAIAVAPIQIEIEVANARGIVIAAPQREVAVVVLHARIEGHAPMIPWGMPELSCLFGRADLLPVLARDPFCKSRLHHFRRCDGLTLSGDGLAVVHLSGSVDLPWQPRASDHPIVERHRWIREALPPPEMTAYWAGRRLAWWWWWERGDDLYADAAWLFSPESLAARATVLAGWDGEEAFVYSGWGEGDEPKPLLQSPFQLAMNHLGFSASVEYFPPAESYRFDWAQYRYGT
jgi:hypothetical protein